MSWVKTDRILIDSDGGISHKDVAIVLVSVPPLLFLFLINLA